MTSLGLRTIYDAEKRAATASKKAAGIGRLGLGGPKGEELAARLADVPADTRCLTARFFGDPLPGRSALDRRNA